MYAIRSYYEDLMMRHQYRLATNAPQTVSLSLKVLYQILTAKIRSRITSYNVCYTKLLRDGGYTYPITLAESVPNTGSFNVVVPNVTAKTTVVATQASIGSHSVNPQSYNFV